MRLIKWFLLIIVAIALQGNSLFNVKLSGAPPVRPDLLLILVIIFSLAKGKTHGMLFGFFLGLVQDSFSSGYLGMNALSKTIVGFLAGRLKRQFYWKNVITQIILTFIFSVISSTIYIFVISILDSVNIGEFKELFNLVLITSCYNSLVSPLVFFVANKFPGDPSE